MPKKKAPLLGKKFDDALQFASGLHREQTRNGTLVPYVAHLLGVASIALEHGANETEAIAALLHDAVEDQGGSAMSQIIRKRFGKKVADIVDGCTDAVVEPKPPWHERKTAYVAHIRKASASVRLVSASDKLYNCRAILNDYRRYGDDLWRRFGSSKHQILWYYGALAAAFRKAGKSTLVDELSMTVDELLHEVDGGKHCKLACAHCGKKMTAQWAPYCGKKCKNA